MRFDTTIVGGGAAGAGAAPCSRQGKRYVLAAGALGR